ncbi:MAG: hypothetical protein ACRYGP_30880 [Janthinobacterium lividum]
MKSTRAAILALSVLQPAAALAAEQDPSAPLHQVRPKARAPSAPAKPVLQRRPVVTPMFEDRDRPESAAERAASLDRRRKAFFAAPAAEAGTPPSDTQGGVTLGGSNGLTPGMGLKF